MKKIVAIVVFAFICLGSVVYGGQNSNSSTTMQSDNSMKNMSGRHGRRHHRRHHRRWHRRGRMGNKNANMQ